MFAADWTGEPFVDSVEVVQNAHRELSNGETYLPSDICTRVAVQLVRNSNEIARVSERVDKRKIFMVHPYVLPCFYTPKELQTSIRL